MKLLKTVTISTICSLALSSMLFAGDGYKGGNNPDFQKITDELSEQQHKTDSDNTECLDDNISTIAGKYPTIYDLTQEQKDGLVFMYQEEKVARDAYLTLYNLWDNDMFSNIAEAEQKHMDGIKTLLEKYSLKIPVLSDTVGVFDLDILQNAYNDLLEKGKVSELKAFEVGKDIEVMDIADLKEKMVDTTADINAVYESLLKGSEHHLDAFNRALSGEDMSEENHSHDDDMDNKEMENNYSENSHYIDKAKETATTAINQVTDIKAVINALSTGEAQTVNGHFIQYGKGTYDWAYVTSDGGVVVKLDGMNTNGSLKWSILHSSTQKGFNSIDISNDGKTILFEANEALILPGVQ